MAYAFFWRRVTASLMISTTLAACSADGLIPPAGIDSGTRVGAIRPMPPTNMPSSNSYGGTSSASLAAPAPQASIQTDASYGYLREPGVNGNPGSAYGGYGNDGAAASSRVRQPMPPASSDAQWGGPMPAQQAGPETQHGGQGRLPKIDSDEGYAAVSDGQSGLSNAEGGGVNIDAELGVGAASRGGVVGLAQEQQTDIADDGEDRVIVPPKRAGNGQRSDVGDMDGTQPWQRQSPAMAQTPLGTRQVGGMQQVAMLRTPNPMEERPPIVPRGPEAMPASEAACRVELRRLGVEFNNPARIYDGPSCGIDYPVELTGLSGNIDVKPSVKLNCETTLAFARWVKYELAPSSRARYWSGVKRIVPLGGYSCRRMNNSRQKYNPISEHARGNAIDVGKFVLKNGHDIDVRKKGLFSFREGGLLKAVRTDSCKYFNTVLGPGSNKEHWNHFHFDLRERKSNSRYCD